MKKNFLLSLVLVILAFVLTSCTMYSSKKGKLEDLVGTYKLTQFIKQEYDAEEDVDMIAKNSIVAYLIVGSQGQGYYIYNGNLSTISIEYTYDGDEIKSIQYNDGFRQTYTKSSQPGYGNETKMGFNVNTKTLSYSQPKFKEFGVKYPKRSVVYTKESDDTTLSYVRTKVDSTLNDQPDFMLKNLNGLFRLYENYCFTEQQEVEGLGLYKYFLADFNNQTKKATLYYKLINGSEGVKEENVDIKFERNNTSTVATIELKDIVFTITLNSLTSSPLSPTKAVYVGSDVVAYQNLSNIYIESNPQYDETNREDAILGYIDEILAGIAG